MRAVGIRKVSRTATAVGGVFVLALGLAACGSSSESEAGGDKLTKITVVPSHLDSASNAAVLAAVANGGFKKCGFDVTLKEGGGGGDTIRTITSGAAQFAFPSVASALPAYVEGNKLAIVAGQALGTNGLAFMVLPDSKLSGVDSLDGKKVGISAAGSNNATELDSIVAAEDLKDVTKVTVGEVPSGVAALAAGAVDATWATEPSVTQLVAQKKAKVLFRVDDYIKDFQLTVTIASQKYADENPEIVKRFVNCMDVANKAIAANPDAAGKTYAKEAKIDEASAITSVKTNLDPNRYSVEVSVPGVEEVIKELIDSKMLKADVSIDNFKDMIQLPEGGAAKLTGGTL